MVEAIEDRRGIVYAFHEPRARSAPKLVVQQFPISYCSTSPTAILFIPSLLSLDISVNRRSVVVKVVANSNQLLVRWSGMGWGFPRRNSLLSTCCGCSGDHAGITYYALGPTRAPLG